MIFQKSIIISVEKWIKFLKDLDFLETSMM